MFTISDEQGEYLVKLARQIIEYNLGLKEKPTKIQDSVLNEKCGVFVTLNVHEKGAYGLRGCIGLPYPVKPLIDAVIEAAESAAFNDPRFPPIKESEMDDITIEISVLTPPEPLKIENPDDYLRNVKIGRDGLIVGKGYRRGLLLPQVPVEWGWDSQNFLTQCCIKAGLPRDEWRRPGTEVLTFQAILFKEEEPNGKVSRHNID